MSEILDFIKVFDSPSNRILFTECACYWFAYILQERFNGILVYNPHQFHFATLINGDIYDITGMLEDSRDYVNWEDYMYEDSESSVIIDNCIYLRRGE